MPEEYEKKLAAYESHLGGKVKLDRVNESVSARAAVFAMGEGSARDNTIMALRVGVPLAFAPFVVALYQYLPTRGISYPYPFADLLAFLIAVTATWLMSVFFFGYFYVHLRGDTGLGKGVHLFAAIVAPFAVYRILHTESLTDMQAFLFWAQQLFLFLTLLGLLGVDYPLLRKNGFRMRDLRSIHNLPALSSYASTVLASVATAALAAVTGRFGEVVQFFMKTIIPLGPASAP
jgi:hypothetical protein